MSCGHCRDLPATHPLPAARCLLQPEAGSRKPRLRRASGGGGIRTHGTPEGSTVFKTVAFVRSATPPHRLPALGFRLEAGGG